MYAALRRGTLPGAEYVKRVTLAFALGLALAVGAPAPLTLAQQSAPESTQPSPSSSSSSSSQDAALPPDLSAPVEKLTKSIEAAEKAVQQLKDLEDELGQLRVNVESILSDSKETAEHLRPRLDAIKDQIEKLGPPPAKDAPPEAAAVSAERARLNAKAAGLESAIKSTELTWVRARQLIERITVLRHSLFTRNLLERLTSPLLPGLWRRAFHEAPGVHARLSYLGRDWLSWARIKQAEIGYLLAAALLVYLLARYIVRRVTRRPPREPPPAFLERAVSAAWVAPVRIIPVLLVALMLEGGLDAIDLLYQPWDRLGTGLIHGVLLFIAISTLLATVFAVREPEWRLFNLSDRSARRICRLLQAIAAVYAIDLALTDAARAFYIPLAISILESVITSLVYAALLIGVLLTRFEPQTSQLGILPARQHPRWLKLPLWIIAAGIIAASLTGYMALGRFVAQQLVMTGLIVLIVGVLYLAARALTREPAAEGHPIGSLLESRFGLDQPRRHQLARLTEICLALLLGLCALPIIMLQWGFSGADIRDRFKSLFFGFEVGQFRISLARILIGLLLFTALLFATRLIQRWLRDRVLQQPKMDPGIANSIDTVVGYAGIAIAALISVSYAGLDITNLAIVAGALSVGIGFGLQSIVNNFVSGLILLIERPVKVGDWIVVGNEQGHVRRISVRATEIETFDRASLIVPNSELITGRVLNWTHRNLLGRVVLKVSVDYGADPDKVMQTLKACADEHPLILKTPEPKAVFEGFGANSLDFSLRFLLGDLNRSIDVQSEMRAAVLRAFRTSGIAMAPAPQAALPAHGNVILRISVARNADPDKVIALLQGCAAEHAQVAKSPAPKAVFDGIGPSSLDFSLHLLLEDPAQALDAQSQIRTAILKALRAAGTEIPHPQHDIHLRDLDGLRAMLARAAEDRKVAGAADGQGSQTDPPASGLHSS